MIVFLLMEGLMLVPVALVLAVSLQQFSICFNPYVMPMTDQRHVLSFSAVYHLLQCCIFGFI